MKWRLAVYNRGKNAVLECYDAGKLTQNKLTSWTDNYPYVDGSIAMDGISVHLCLKLSAMNAYGGIPFDSNAIEILKPTFPETFSVHFLDAQRDNAVRNTRRTRQPVIKLPKRMTFEEIQRQFREVKCWVSDSRILLLSYLVFTQTDCVLWYRLTTPIPSRKKALEILEKYGLARPFHLGGKLPLRFYETYSAFIDEMHCKFAPEKQEILAALEDAPLRMPLQEIKVAGVFAIKDKEYILRALKIKQGNSYEHVSIPVTLLREPQNSHDRNAICVEAEIDGADYKLGYIPKALAQKLAPMMDKGSSLNAIIAEQGIEGQEIKIKISIRKGMESFKTLTIDWGELAGKWEKAEINAEKRTITYVCRKQYHYNNAAKMTLTFSQDEWEENILPILRRCAFTEWSTVYRQTRSEYSKNLWRVVVTTEKGEMRKYGCNRYPIEWVHWLAFIKPCFQYIAF